MDVVVSGHFNVAGDGDVVVTGDVHVLLIEIHGALGGVYGVGKLPHTVKALAEGVRLGGVFLLAGVEHVIAVRVQPVYAEYPRIVQPFEFGLHDSSFPA